MKVESFKSPLTGDNIQYVIYTPDGYDGTQKLPLIVSLSGSDEKTWPIGAFNSAIRNVGLPAQMEAGMKLNAIVVAPCIAYGDWDNISVSGADKYLPGALAVDVAKYIETKYNTDPAKRYVTGYSMGGGGTWSTLLFFPDFWAAGIPISGWGNPPLASSLNTPVRIFHNIGDGRVNANGSKSMFDAIKAAKPNLDATLTLYPVNGHDAWTQTYKNPDIYNWLLSKSNAAIPPVVTPPPAVVPPPPVAPSVKFTISPVSGNVYIGGNKIEGPVTIEIK